MASILVISLCTESLESGLLLSSGCAYGCATTTGEGGGRGAGWREKRVLVGRRKAWAREGGRQRLFKVCATPRGSFYYSLGRWSVA